MADKEVKVKVSAIDAASGALKKIGVEADNLGQAGQKFRVNWTAAGAAMTAGGGAIVGGLTAAAMSASKAGSELYDMSTRTGASVEALSQLSYAAQQTGGDIGSVETALKFVSKNAYAAATGNKKAQEAFAALGVSVTDSSGKLKSAETLFTEAGAALRGIDNDATRTALSVQVFGRSGTKLIPMFTDVNAGIGDLMKQADALGLTLSQKDAAAADEFGDKLDALKASTGRLWMQIGTQVLPILTELVKAVQPVVSGLIAWGKEHPKLASGLTMVVGGVGALMAAVGPLIMALPALKAGMAILGIGKVAAEAGAASTALGSGGLLGVLKGAPAVLSGAGSGVAAFGAKLVSLAGGAGPLAVVIIAVAALAYELYKLKQAWDKTAEAGKQAGQAYQDAMAAEDAYAAKTGTQDQLAKQRQAREKARVTVSDRFWGAMTGGGRTGKDIARERVAMAQPVALPRRAGGGQVTAGMPYIVGERGKELFVPDANGTILPGPLPGSVAAGGGVQGGIVRARRERVQMQNVQEAQYAQVPLPRGLTEAAAQVAQSLVIELRLDRGIVAEEAANVLRSRDGRDVIVRVVKSETARAAPASAYGGYG